jgi:phosphomannomutase
MALKSGGIVHLRPSGNAPELSCYVETSNLNCSKDYVGRILGKILKILKILKLVNR